LTSSRNTIVRSLHDVGAAGWFGGSLMGAVARRDRIRSQSGVGANTAVKTVLTAAALGATAYSGLLGAKLGRVGDVPAEGGTVPGDATPGDIARSHERLRILQWATPVLTGALVVLGAQQGEQQRPGQRIRSGRKKAS
jgi:hypothetical protein